MKAKKRNAAPEIFSASPRVGPAHTLNRGQSRGLSAHTLKSLLKNLINLKDRTPHFGPLSILCWAATKRMRARRRVAKDLLGLQRLLQRMHRRSRLSPENLRENRGEIMGVALPCVLFGCFRGPLTQAGTELVVAVKPADHGS